MLLEEIVKQNGYICYLINDTTKKELINKFPPKFSKVICHHITEQYPATNLDILPTINTLKIIGYSSDEYSEAFVVEVNNTIYRPDNNIYHLTYSLNPKNRKPVDSNILVKKSFEHIKPIVIKAIPTFIAFSK